MATLTGTQPKTRLNTAEEEIIAGFVALIFFGHTGKARNDHATLQSRCGEPS
jgi:hypothetical protein